MQGDALFRGAGILHLVQAHRVVDVGHGAGVAGDGQGLDHARSVEGVVCGDSAVVVVIVDGGGVDAVRG